MGNLKDLMKSFQVLKNSNSFDKTASLDDVARVPNPQPSD